MSNQCRKNKVSRMKPKKIQVLFFFLCSRKRVKANCFMSYTVFFCPLLYIYEKLIFSISIKMTMPWVFMRWKQPCDTTVDLSCLFFKSACIDHQVWLKSVRSLEFHDADLLYPFISCEVYFYFFFSSSVKKKKSIVTVLLKNELFAIDDH